MNDAHGGRISERHVKAGRGDGPGLALLLAAFFLSGFAALVYQTVWQRMLGMFAGSDSVTAAIVVGAFLLGLGVGTLAASLIADRLTIRQAVLGFALCEIGVALFALASRAFLQCLGVVLVCFPRSPCALLSDGHVVAVPDQGGSQQH